MFVTDGNGVYVPVLADTDSYVFSLNQEAGGHMRPQSRNPYLDRINRDKMKDDMSDTEYQTDVNAIISENFSYKECTAYVERQGGEGRCFCGLSKMEHDSDVSGVETAKWSLNSIVTKKPTNFCGTHTLTNGRQIQYLRLADSDDPDKLLHEMCTSWQMKDERALTLVLSLITSPTEGIPENLEEGLLQSVLVNSCWIISSGYNDLAILTEVSEERVNSNHGKCNFCNICVTPWKTNYLDLWQNEVPESRDMTTFKKFTHCIFVDSGMETPSAVSAAKEYRHRLEERIRKETGFPIIRILIAGELRDLVNVLMGVKSGYPLLICAGTGGIADILAQALIYAGESPGYEEFTPAQKAHLQVLLRAEDVKLDENNVRWSYNLLVKVVGYRKLVSVFDVLSDVSFDKKIFETFAKSEDQRGLQALIRWAFIKDWAPLLDGLGNDIWMAFMHDLIQKRLCMCDCKDNADLLQHCIKNGFGLAVKIDKEASDCMISSQLLNNVSVSMVPGMFVNLLTQITKIMMAAALILPALWAVVLERYDIARLFWKRCRDPVSAGLTISRVCGKLMQVLPQYDTENYEILSEQQVNFEKLTVQLIERYNSEQPSRAVELLQMNPHYLPDQIGCSLFICSLPIQHIVEHDWWQGFNTNPLAIVVSFFFPFLTFTRLFSFAPVIVTDQPPLSPSSSIPSASKSNRRNPTRLEKLQKFYKAPITKFYTHALFYLVFILFYGFTLIGGLRSNYISIFEAVIAVELISFLTETVFEVIPMLDGSCRYGSFVQNVLELPSFYKYDLLLNALNIITIILGLGRLVPFEAIKTLYAVSFLLHSFRFFKFYYFYSNLGPKLAMIERMLEEMLEFLAFLLVFLLSTGVVMEALLYINRTNIDADVLRDIFSVQFYRLYGENNLELAEGNKEGCTTPDGIQCPISNPLVPWLVYLFMLIAVTLLMNLLIAIFSNVFSQFESESRELWKRARCHLLFEFKEKTVAPMPLNMIERFIQMSVAVFRACQRAYRTCTARHAVTQVTEETPLKPSFHPLDDQSTLLPDDLEGIATKSMLNRMEMDMDYIRRKSLPRLLENLEQYPEDTATNMFESLRYRLDAGIKELVQNMSDMRSEVIQRLERLEGLPETATPVVRGH
nr:unnamed protein product [Spirometra erinaceieuropaei]